MPLPDILPKDTNQDVAYNSWNDILRPLLNALKWNGEERNIIEAMHLHNELADIDQFRDVMSYIGFKSTIITSSLHDIEEKHYPVIFLDENNSPHLITSNDNSDFITNGRFLIFNSTSDRERYDNKNLYRLMQEKFYPIIKQSVFLSLIIGVCALSPTFYNMSIYDYIIPSGTKSSVTMLFAGVAIALTLEIILRNIRSRKLSYLGARIDHFSSSMVFERLLFISPRYTENNQISAQLTRLRDFESIRDFFTGPLASLIFEIPLVAVYLIAMAVLANWMVTIPVFIIFLYCVLIFLALKIIKTSSAESAKLYSIRHAFLLETMIKLKSIRLGGIDDIWQERYRKLSGDASMASFKCSLQAQAIEIVSYAIMTFGGAATISFGVFAVISGYITLGALFASMMLIWRILTPLQTCCASITRIQQLIASSSQVNNLLKITPEHSPYKLPDNMEKPHGTIKFHRVSVKYIAENEYALLGVSFEIKQGEIVAIKGYNGSGKTTILKLILGLYQQQNGNIQIGGIDIRQFNPVFLRQNIAYAPQVAHLFPGTIKENLLLSNPAATDDECFHALQMACALDEVNSLKDGIYTRITGENDDSISFMLRQRINLARAYINAGNIILFDEAAYSLGEENDVAFAQSIEKFRGKKTVIMVTHREDHMMLADKLIVLDKGELTAIGKPQNILHKAGKKLP